MLRRALLVLIGSRGYQWALLDAIPASSVWTIDISDAGLDGGI